MAPQDGWDELPDCATDCFLDGLKDTGCEEGDTTCFCEDGKWDVLSEALDGCKDCSGNDLWRLAASFRIMCDDQDSPSSTAEPTPSPTLFIAHDQPTSESDSSTSLTFIPIASHTPTLDTTELKTRDHGIPTPTIIGMAVGFAVAALLIVGLVFFYLRERRRRKSWEWTTENKRESKLGSRLSLPSKRASKPSTTTAASNSKRGSSVQVLDRRGWRPTGTTTTTSSP